jgi:hypothetical protein
MISANGCRMGRLPPLLRPRRRQRPARRRAAGSPEVYWLTQDSNRTAQRLYDVIAEQSGYIFYQKKVVP